MEQGRGCRHGRRGQVLRGHRRYGGQVAGVASGGGEQGAQAPWGGWGGHATLLLISLLLFSWLQYRGGQI